MSNNESLHSILSSKAAAFLSWLSAFLGLGTFMGLVNALIGVLSACWLLVSLWNYFSHTRKKNRIEMQILEHRLEEANQPRPPPKAEH